MDDKNKLEEKITRAAEELFSIPEAIRSMKDGKQEVPEELKALRAELTSYVLQWVKQTFANGSLKNTGVEIMDCIALSIRTFKGTPGDYIKYISVSVKNQIQRAKEKNNVFQAQLIRLPEKKRRLIRQIRRYAESSGMNIEDVHVQNQLSDIFHLGLSENGVSGISQLLQWESRSSVQNETSINEDGDEISIIDTKEVFKKAGGKKPEDEAIEKQEIEQLVASIDSAFSGYQDRTKPYLSALLTRQVLEELESAGTDSSSSLEYLKGRAFSMMDEALKVKEAFLSGDSCPAQQEVAAWFGKDKTDASRTMRNFLEKLKRREEAVDSLKT